MLICVWKIKGEAVAEIALALLYLWKAALHALPDMPGQEDLELVTKLAKVTPTLVEAWWNRYHSKIPTWVGTRALEDRAEHILLLVDPITFCNTLTPLTQQWNVHYSSSKSPLNETLMDM